MNAPRWPDPLPASHCSGSATYPTGPRLLWMSGLFLAACLLVVTKPVRAQSLGLGFSAVSASQVSGWSIWTDVSVGFRSRPSYRWGANRGCSGFRFGGGYHYRGWGWWGPAHWGPLAVYPYIGPGAYRCLPPWQYGFGWSRPAFAWALYPIPLPYGGHPRFGYGGWSGPWSFDVHISFRGSPGYRWGGGYGYAGRSYGNRWYVARPYAGGYGRYALYGNRYWPGRAEARRPARARRAAGPGRLGSAGWISPDPATDVTFPHRDQLRTARTRTTSSAATRQAQPAGRRALSRTGPVTTSSAAIPDIGAPSPGQSDAVARSTAGTANGQRLARARSSAPTGPLQEGRAAATERRGASATPPSRMASPREATTPAPPPRTTPAPTPGTTTRPPRSARTRPSRAAGSLDLNRPAAAARPTPPAPGTRSAAPRRATRPAPRPSASPPQTAPRSAADPPRTARARLSRSQGPVRTTRPTPPVRTAPSPPPSTPRSRPAAAPQPSARPVPASPPSRAVLGRSGPRMSSPPASGRAPNAGGRRTAR